MELSYADLFGKRVIDISDCPRRRPLAEQIANAFRDVWKSMTLISSNYNSPLILEVQTSGMAHFLDERHGFGRYLHAPNFRVMLDPECLRMQKSD